MEFSCKSERTLGCGILWQFPKIFKIFTLFRISKKTFPMLSEIFNLFAMDYSGIASKYSPLLLSIQNFVDFCLKWTRFKEFLFIFWNERELGLISHQLYVVIITFLSNMKKWCGYFCANNIRGHPHMASDFRVGR